MILGITGGIASGKTTVMRILAGRGIPTVSSDDLSHACIKRGRPAYQAIVRRFGRDILSPSGQINRHQLGEIVFADPKKRRTLEKIVHPCVVRGLKLFIKKHRTGIIALDIPLLFEAKLQKLVDKIVVVYCSRNQQITRLRRRMGLSRAQALARIHSQSPLDLKRRMADIVVMNTRKRTQLSRQARASLAVLSAQLASVKEGRNQLSSEEIEREIAAVRKKRAA
jgi:dephospho-CoA kinase